VLLAIDARGRVLLQRRPPAGIWASLWSLPEAATHEAAREWAGAHLAVDYDAAEPLDPVAHGFTHYRLTMQPLLWRKAAPRAGAVEDDASLRWVSRNELPALGIPAPVRSLLERQLP